MVRTPTEVGIARDHLACAGPGQSEFRAQAIRDSVLSFFTPMHTLEAAVTIRLFSLSSGMAQPACFMSRLEHYA